MRRGQSGLEQTKDLANQTGGPTGFVSDKGGLVMDNPKPMKGSKVE